MIAAPVKPRSTQWFRALVESLADAVIVSSTEGSIEFMNKTAEKLIGISAASAHRNNLASVLRLHTKDGSPVRTDLINLAILSGSGMTLGDDLVLRRANGDQIDVDGEIAPFKYSASHLGVVVTFRDVTLRNRDQASGHRNQTLRAVAQLSGSIAHDLNNALTLILGHTEELLTRIPRDDASRAVVEQIRDAGDLAARVSGQLQNLGRKEILLPKVLNLNDIIEEQRDALGRITGAGIRITTELTELHGEFQADPEQIRIMLTNFVLYGNQLLPLGGQIAFQTADMEVAPVERGARIRRYVRMRITYTGSEVRDEDLENLFKPYWRQEGGPQGLELFTTAGIVSDASGHISVDKESGVSMTFDVSFPCIEDPHPLLFNQDSASEQRKPTILLVEDDDDIRSLLSRYFDRQGYHLLEARDGEDALMTSELYDGLIDVLITDVVMPRMSGTQLVNLMAKNRPETKALLISGYAPESAALSDFLEQGVHFLQKPFRSEELLAQVQQILTERKPKVN